MYRKFIFFALVCLASSLGRAQTTSWKSESSGLWILEENWTAGIPNSGNADASFDSIAGDPDGIIVDVTSPITLSSLSFNNRIPLELSGSPIRFAGENLVDVTPQAEDLRIGTPLSVAPDDTLTIRTSGDSYLRIDARHQDDANGTLRKTGTGELSWSRSGTGWSGEVVHELGAMNVSAATRLGALTVMGGTLNGRGNLTVDNDIEFYAGRIDMDESAYVAAPRLVKRGWSSAQLTGLGEFSPAPIHVEAGILTISSSSNALGGSTGPTSVAPRYAQLLLKTNSEDRIQLNGSRGFANRGGLSTSIWLTGGIDVGEGRSIVRADRSTQIENIGGDGILAIYGGNFVLENDTHSFTGDLELGVPGIETGGFVLANEAVFRSVSSVTINSYSELVLNNRSGRQQVKVDNRIGNVPTINMRGGNLIIESDDTNVTESLGDVIVHEGFNQFDAKGNAIQVNVRTFNRSGNGVFNTDLGLNAGFDGSSTLMFETSPELSFGMLGAWITVDRDFATYDETIGIMPLYRKVTKLDTFDAADETSHLEFFGSPAPLQSDKSIASMTTSLGGGTLDLSGHRLNIASGGWISSGAGNVGNGTITAGVSGSNSELILYSYSDRQPLEVSARIVDNENGSTAVTLKGRVVLSGENRYSGATTVPEGSVLATAPAAFPSGGDLNIEGGRYHFDFSSDKPVLAGQVKISQSGTLLGGDVSGDGRADVVLLDASSYLLNSGVLEMDLVGDGPLRKTTHGRAEIQGNNLGYHGQIDVFDGVLVAGGNSITNGTNALGTGKTIVHTGGTLVHGSVDSEARRTYLRGNIELRGGDLAAGGYSGLPLIIEGSIDVSQDSMISVFDVFDGTVLSEDTTFQIDSSVVLGSNVTTTLQGNGQFEFNGEIEVGDGSTLVVPEGDLRLDGTIVARDATSQLVVSGPGANRFRAGIVIPKSTSFELVENGQKTEIAIRSANNSLSGNGTLANDLHLSLQGRVRPGDGTDGVGHLTVDGSVTLAAGGEYEWQVGNVASPAAWDSIDATGNVAFTSTSASPFRFSLSASSDSSFDPSQVHRWPLLAGNELSGFSSDVIEIDETRIREQFAIPAEARFSIEEVENRLELVYSMSSVVGDFDQNGLLDALDIDLLSRNILAGSEDLVFDLDQNSVVDDADRLHWIRTLMQTYLGDSNLDGVFDSSDLVAVFKADEYEDTVFGNSTWSTGDWNGDGEFDSSDLVAAFKENGYEQGPRTKAVPETTGNWINITLVAFIYWRRGRSKLLNSGTAVFRRSSCLD